MPLFLGLPFGDALINNAKIGNSINYMVGDQVKYVGERAITSQVTYSVREAPTKSVWSICQIQLFPWMPYLSVPLFPTFHFLALPGVQSYSP